MKLFNILIITFVLPFFFYACSSEFGGVGYGKVSGKVYFCDELYDGTFTVSLDSDEFGKITVSSSESGVYEFEDIWNGSYRVSFYSPDVEFYPSSIDIVKTTDSISISDTIVVKSWFLNFESGDNGRITGATQTEDFGFLTTGDYLRNGLGQGRVTKYDRNGKYSASYNFQNPDSSTSTFYKSFYRMDDSDMYVFLAGTCNETTFYKIYIQKLDNTFTEPCVDPVLAAGGNQKRGYSGIISDSLFRVCGYDTTSSSGVSDSYILNFDPFSMTSVSNSLQSNTDNSQNYFSSLVKINNGYIAFGSKTFQGSSSGQITWTEYDDLFGEPRVSQTSIGGFGYSAAVNAVSFSEASLTGGNEFCYVSVDMGNGYGGKLSSALLRINVSDLSDWKNFLSEKHLGKIAFLNNSPDQWILFPERSGILSIIYGISLDWDNGILLAGAMIKDSYYDSVPVVCKLDKYGRLIWRKELETAYPGMSAARWIDKAHDGGYICGGSRIETEDGSEKAFLMKLNREGKIYKNGELR